MAERTWSYTSWQTRDLPERTPGSWLSWLLLLIALSSITAGLAKVIWGLQFPYLFFVTLFSITLQWFLASLPQSRRLAPALSAVVGLEYVLIRAGGFGNLLLPAWRAQFELVWEAIVWIWSRLTTALVWLLQNGIALLAWLLQREREAPPLWTGPPNWGYATPWARIAEPLLKLWAGMGALLSGWQRWLLTLVDGSPGLQEASIKVAWGLLLWGLASWAAWVVRRHRNAPLALLPAGVILGYAISYTGASAIYLMPLLISSLLLMAVTQHERRELLWRGQGVRFSRDLWSKLVLRALSLSIILAIAAAVVPELPTQSLTDWANEHILNPDPEPLGDSLGLEKQAQPPVVIGVPPLLGLPNEHAITGNPQLTAATIMEVSTGDQRPLLPAEDPATNVSAPVYRWRSHTFDTYTGQSWVTTNTLKIAYEGGVTLLDPEGVANHRQLHQTIRRVYKNSIRVHVAGTLVSLEQDYEVTWRNGDEFFGATTNAETYDALALLPTFTEADLRQTGADYPQWVTQSYLQLPDDIPQRVRDLAAEVTAGQPTPYDRARALETHLRTYTYTLEVPAPPPGREVADYFLFDLQEGYCDYYATSMVVMARAVGLPARIVMGYIGGDYDPIEAVYSVAEEDAHAWVEIYFPGYGWIEFEPTAGRPSIYRISGEPMNISPVSPVGVTEPPYLPEEEELWPEGGSGTVTTARQIAPLILLGGGTIAVVVGTALLLTLLDSAMLLLHPRPAEMVAVLYTRLRRHALKLKIPLTQGSTPHEFATLLRARLDQPEIANVALPDEELPPILQESQALIAAYVQAWYTPHPIDAERRRATVWAWWKLRWRLWFARLVQMFQREEEGQEVARPAPAVYQPERL